ncbi:MAG: hypothetical protein WCJ56_02040 [bacterium]
MMQMNGMNSKNIGNRRAHRGQALVVAVLIMFILVGLGGVFIALVNRAMVQTVKSGERDKLEEITRAGLEYAKKMLLYSPDGADWRPTGDTILDTNPALKGFNKFGDGFYRISINYGAGNSPLARFVHINIQAYLAEPNRLDTDQLPKPFITRSLDAYMPLGLPDYLRWVTNADGKPDPVTLGSTVLLADPDGTGMSTVKSNPSALSVTDLTTVAGNDYENPAKRTKLSANTPVVSWYDGPIRSEAPLQLGNMRLDLTTTNGRFDALEVAGNVSELSASTTGSAGVHLVKDNKLLAVDTAATTDRLPTRLTDPAWVASLQSVDNNQLVRGLRAPVIEMRDPATGQDRYRTLTRDSVNHSSATVNTSIDVLGWGEGIYLNNQKQIQYNHNIDQLRQEWLNPSDTAPWYNGTYNPAKNGQATEIVLGDWQLDASGNLQLDANGIPIIPKIQLRRYDAPFVDEDGKQLIAQQEADGCYYMYTSYPRNGVIFAEGNLVVKGNLPASVMHSDLVPYPPTGKPGGFDTNGSIKYYVDDYNRRFDLTIVSGGTVYIDGNLLSPGSRGTAVVGSDFDSKLALLATDNVVLNPTHLFDFTSATSQPPQALNGENLWRLSQGAGSALTVSFSTAGAGISRMLLRHAGDSSNLITPYTQMRMSVNNVVYPWDVANTNITLRDKMVFSTLLAKSTLFPTASMWSSNLFPDSPLGLQVLSSFPPQIKFYGSGQTNTVKFEVAGGGDYLLGAGTVDGTLGAGFLVTGLDLQVDALCYAQRGSWFVIPGKYSNESADPVIRNQPWPFPKYKEPQDVRIIFNGAIIENRPAPLEMVNEWTRHWRGANPAYFATNGTDPDLLDPAKAAPGARRMGIEYHYDEALSIPVCFDINSQGNKAYKARLPKLPVSPNVYSIGQQSGM